MKSDIYIYIYIYIYMFHFNKMFLKIFKAVFVGV